MISAAQWQAWPGFEAFYVSAQRGPAYLIQIDRKDLARRLLAGDTLETIVTGPSKGDQHDRRHSR